MQMLDSVSALINTVHSSAVTRCLWAWEGTPKILITGAPIKTFLIIAQGMQESKEINNESYDRCQLAAFKDVCFWPGIHIHNTPGNIKSSSTALRITVCTHLRTHASTLQGSAISRTLSTKPYFFAYSSSRQAHTRTEWDGTGYPSFSSNPGAQALRQDTDHTFSQICSKFIPEPTRQIKTESTYH